MNVSQSKNCQVIFALLEMNVHLSVFRSTVIPSEGAARGNCTYGGKAQWFWLKQILADSREAPSLSLFERFAEVGRGWRCGHELKCVLVVSRRDLF